MPHSNEDPTKKLLPEAFGEPVTQGAPEGHPSPENNTDSNLDLSCELSWSGYIVNGEYASVPKADAAQAIEAAYKNAQQIELGGDRGEATDKILQEAASHREYAAVWQIAEAHEGANAYRAIAVGAFRNGDEDIALQAVEMFDGYDKDALLVRCVQEAVDREDAKVAERLVGRIEEPQLKIKGLLSIARSGNEDAFSQAKAATMALIKAAKDDIDTHAPNLITRDMAEVAAQLGKKEDSHELCEAITDPELKVKAMARVVGAGDVEYFRVAHDAALLLDSEVSRQFALSELGENAARAGAIEQAQRVIADIDKIWEGTSEAGRVKRAIKKYHRETNGPEPVPEVEIPEFPDTPEGLEAAHALLKNTFLQKLGSFNRQISGGQTNFYDPEGRKVLLSHSLPMKHWRQPKEAAAQEQREQARRYSVLFNPDGPTAVEYTFTLDGPVTGSIYDKETHGAKDTTSLGSLFMATELQRQTGEPEVEREIERIGEEEANRELERLVTENGKPLPLEATRDLIKRVGQLRSHEQYK